MVPPNKPAQNLAEVVRQRPFPEFTDWWKMGHELFQFMSRAIIKQWIELVGSLAAVDMVQSHFSQYLKLVYDHEPDSNLVKRLVMGDTLPLVYSGEFDALSFAFYRSAFEYLAGKHQGDEAAVVQGRKDFTKLIGRRFFNVLHDHLQLDLPPGLNSPQEFALLQKNIQRIGHFLLKQGYLRDHCEFTFTVDVNHAGKPIRQGAADFLSDLRRHQRAFALYIMGYPAILPSAVYLYQLFGEAQHHSSRTIEELFDRLGYTARETPDFDPSTFPSDQVVELWVISPKN